MSTCNCEQANRESGYEKVIFNNQGENLTAVFDVNMKTRILKCQIIEAKLVI